MKLNNSVFLFVTLGVFAFVSARPDSVSAYGFYRNFYGQPYRLRSSYVGSTYNEHPAHRFFVSGCSASRDGKWTQEIYAAAAEWNEVRGMQDKLEARWAKCASIQGMYRNESRVEVRQLRGRRGYRIPRKNVATAEYRSFLIVLDDDLDASPRYCNAAPNGAFDGTGSWVRPIAIHELGHGLGLRDVDYQQRQTIMHGDNSDAVYCGPDGLAAAMPHADDNWGGRELYPTITPHRDIAPLAYRTVAPTSYPPNGGVRRIGVAGVVAVCPGAEVTEEWAVANRGSEVWTYDRTFSLSPDRILDGTDAQLNVCSSPNTCSQTAEFNRTKSARQGFGELDSLPVAQTRLEMPDPFPASEQYLILAATGDLTAQQSRGSSRRNDWTCFARKYEEETMGCP